MTRLPVISTDAELNKVIARICEKYQDIFRPVFIGSSDEALEYLNYELPEISLINFSDALIESGLILETIKSDPWLHFGGIIGVHRKKDEARARLMMRDSSIISLISRGNVVSDFYRLLGILVQNRQIIFQRDLQTSLLHDISGSFVMDSDPFNVRAYTNLIVNYLYNSNYINQDGRDRLHAALFEMLMNAVEHGNCRISYDEKNAWLNAGCDILDLIREKLKDPLVRMKRIFFSYRISDDSSSFCIRDEGEGFDWRSWLADRTGVNLEMHGHGIRMTAHYIENMRYNEKGNEVSFDIRHRERQSNVIPGLFADREEVIFDDGSVVFTEGEESNYLYYIASGNFDILAQDKKLATLTPQDIFLGEMSFLLNNRRSATVISRGRSTLLKISKYEFVNTIKQKPYYGILLARLVAQRLSSLNTTISRLKQKAM